jgi:cytochrome c oxidase subunit 4
MTQTSTAAERPKMIWRRNLIVWLALMLLVALTLGLAFLPLGSFNLPIALAIAAAKALLVAFMFMELRLAKPFVFLAASAGVVWLLIMFTLTFSDLLWRFSQ